ncbi:Transcription initiation factor TFIID subunit 2 [Zancudomyces culisetae]|uniref:Transcription initiation factor TFIID subunit 2 n=1 Tax=Zancudomyces culisetae TaxID=1213189 RepID=A0A1R1PLP7_ZANCU|nr:Transcription initiation factor TFIID subunit 2 [Zancudomyces culisetae]|eukprot:OMH81890.1 Transcription initiation factor TFIID subunit 2 [Zancudomyces culisetae]
MFGAESEAEKQKWRVVEWGEDDEASLHSSSVEWIRIDSDMEWACRIQFEQADYMWAAQLQRDRDVVAQVESVDALKYLPSAAASTSLMRTVMDTRVLASFGRNLSTPILRGGAGTAGEAVSQEKQFRQLWRVFYNEGSVDSHIYSGLSKRNNSSYSVADSMECS